MKLLARGTLLVAFPLLCQVVLVVVLLFLLWQLELEMTEESHSKDLISAVHDLGWHAIENVYRINFESAMMKTQVSDAASDEATKRFEINVEKIKKLASSNVRQRKSSEELDSAARHIVQLFNGVREEYRNGRIDTRKVTALNQQLTNAFAGLLNTMIEMVAIEETELKKSPERTRDLRFATHMTLAAALGIGLFTAVVFGLLYARGIRQPIARIAENSRLLSLREPLLPSSKSADELGSLDRLMHSVADDVRAALSKEIAMIENAADMICSLDEDGVFVEVNPATEKLLNKKASELIGTHLLEIVVAEDCLIADQNWQACRLSADRTEFELRLRKGQTQIETRWSVLWSELHSSLFCVVHDVTEEKKVERLKQDFLNMISHDLRSPLTSMLASLTLITEGVTGPVSSEVQSEVDEAISDIEILISFVNDLLDVQKLREGKMSLLIEPVDLMTLIDDSIKLVKRFAEGKNVVIEAPTGSWCLNVDKVKMMQVIVNLLGNAIKFSPGGSIVRIVVTCDLDHLQLSVIDNGPGVPEEYREKIFGVFEQVPAHIKHGSGLGLAISRMIIDAHGGSIGVDDNSGKVATDGRAQSGSTFWLRLGFDDPAK